jgi:hypothetical protein
MGNRVRQEWQACLQEEAAKLARLKAKRLDALAAYRLVMSEINEPVIKPTPKEMKKAWQAIQNKRETFNVALEPVSMS